MDSKLHTTPDNKHGDCNFYNIFSSPDYDFIYFHTIYRGLFLLCMFYFFFRLASALIVETRFLELAMSFPLEYPGFFLDFALRENRLSGNIVDCLKSPLNEFLWDIRHGRFDIQRGGGGARIFRTKSEQDYFFRRTFGTDYFFHNQKLHLWHKGFRDIYYA